MNRIFFLIAALKDTRWSVRERAAVALGRIQHARAVDPLIRALKDADRRVEWAVAYILGEIGDARAVVPLIQILSEERCAVPREVVTALDTYDVQNLRLT